MSAIEALTMIEDPAIVPSLILVLDSYDKKVREMATIALVRLADTQTVQPLLKQLPGKGFARHSSTARNS